MPSPWPVLVNNARPGQAARRSLCAVDGGCGSRTRSRDGHRKNNVATGLRAASPPPGHKPERGRIAAPIPSCDGNRPTKAAPLRLVECIAENVALNRMTMGRVVMVTINGLVARSWLFLCAPPVFPSKEEFGHY